MMKYVAGFHSLVFFLGFRFSLRRGFGISDFQKLLSATVGYVVLYGRGQPEVTMRWHAATRHNCPVAAMRTAMRCTIISILRQIKVKNVLFEFRSVSLFGTNHLAPTSSTFYWTLLKWFSGTNRLPQTTPDV